MQGVMMKYTALFDQGKAIQLTIPCWLCGASALSPASLADTAVSPEVVGLRAPSLNLSQFSQGGGGNKPMPAFLLSPVMAGTKENLLFW